MYWLHPGCGGSQGSPAPLSSTCRYIFTITVADNSNTAYVHRVGDDVDTHPQDQPVAVCCGSSREVPASQRQATGQFIRTAAGPVVDIVSVEMDRDIFPPATIGDLGVTYNSDEEELIASWTAPGDDYNDGEVSGYHLVYSASIDSLLQPVSEDRELIVILRRDRAGVSVEQVFQLQGGQGEGTATYLLVIEVWLKPVPHQLRWQRVSDEGKIVTIIYVVLSTVD